MPATYIPIQTQTLTTTAGIVYFNNIPQTYRDLVLVQTARVTSTYDITAIRVNGQASGYSNTYLYTDGSSNASGRGTAEISMRAGYIPGTGAPYIGEWSNEKYEFIDYQNRMTYKTILHRTNFVTGAGTGFNAVQKVTTVPIQVPITQITSQTANGANFAAGSTFTLYGIGGA